MPDKIQTIVGSYVSRPAAFRDYDPRAADVARLVAALVYEHLPWVRVEHVGSTSVPGCAGNGNIDLMIAVADGELDKVKEVLDRLGFQGRIGRDPFPETRPMPVRIVCPRRRDVLNPRSRHPHQFARSGRDAVLSCLPACRPRTAEGLRRPETKDHRQRRYRFAGLLQAQGRVHQGSIGIAASSELWFQPERELRRSTRPRRDYSGSGTTRHLTTHSPLERTS